MKENKQKHYLIYQITNLVNGKIYIGKHETFNIEDNYFGSGNLVRAAINKHGLENFEFKILIDLKSREEMNLLEKMVVTEEFCEREDVYNIKVGGEGGWDHVNWKSGCQNHIKKKKAGQLGGIAGMRSMKKQNTSPMEIFFKRSTKERIERWYSHITAISRQWHQEHSGYFAGERNPMYGHVYTDETRQKMSIGQSGSRNSQYGKMWICNDLTKESRSILKTDPIPDGWRKGRICKK